MTTKNLCELAQQTIQPILESTGHELSLADFDDVAALNEVAYKVMHPNDPRAFRLLMRAVPVGETGISLHPATISRVLWIHEYAPKMFVDDVMQYGAMVYALSVKDPRDLFDADADDIAEEVGEIVQKMDVSPAELVTVMGQVMRMTGEGSGDDDADPEYVYGPIVAALVREYAGSHEYWLHDASMDVVESTLDDMQRRNEAENESSAAAAGSKHFARAYLDSMAELRVHQAELQEKWGAA